MLSLFSPAHRYPIGSVNIIGIDEAWIADKKKRIPNSLWAANYELRHVKDVDPEFGGFQWFKDLPKMPGGGCTLTRRSWARTMWRSLWGAH